MFFIGDIGSLIIARDVEPNCKSGLLAVRVLIFLWIPSSVPCFIIVDEFQGLLLFLACQINVNVPWIACGNQLLAQLINALELRVLCMAENFETAGGHKNNYADVRDLETIFIYHSCVFLFKRFAL